MANLYFTTGAGAQYISHPHPSPFTRILMALENLNQIGTGDKRVQSTNWPKSQLKARILIAFKARILYSVQCTTGLSRLGRLSAQKFGPQNY